MNISEYLTVFIPTHIIRADTDPYIQNRMIFETIKQSHDKLNLGDVAYKIYPDAKFKRTHPELMKQYSEYLNSMKNSEELSGINIEIVEETCESMRKNWLKFVQEDCETPYMIFLEHDWGFPREIETEKIISNFEKNPTIGYIKLNHFAHDNAMRHLASPKNWDWIFEQEKDLDLDVPLFKITFFSGNPHFARISKCKEFYINQMLEHCPPEKSRGTSHLEKDMKAAELYSIDSRRDCGEKKISGHRWPLSGLYMLGDWGDASRVSHLGDWCRKQ